MSRQLNATPAPTVEVTCTCRARSACQKCNGTGVRTVRSCKRCGGTGSDAKVRDVPPKCLDCKGDGWRTLDNEVEPITDERF